MTPERLERLRRNASQAYHTGAAIASHSYIELLDECEALLKVANAAVEITRAHNLKSTCKGCRDLLEAIVAWKERGPE